MSATSATPLRPARPPRRTQSREELLARLPALAAEIRVGASERERSGELPHASFALFRQSGLGALRVPEERGGPGGSVSDLVEVIAALACGDPNVAHALRSHYNFSEQQVLAPETPAVRERLDRILDGTLFAGASTELGTAKPGQLTTRLTRHGDHFRLTGRKYYATGTAFADYASISALDDGGSAVTVLIPTDRPGFVVHDDWDGMGQRLTASGSVELNDVEVRPDEVGQREWGQLIGRHCSALRQLHLAAVGAGIVRNIAEDATDYVRRHARAALHSDAETGRQDPFVQQVLGEVTALSFAVDAIIASAAEALDRSVAALTGAAPDADETIIAGALAVARAQVASYPLALKAAETLFEVGGASTTARRTNFDRHWRNIRTLATHNPLRQKARVIGDFAANGTTTHLKAGRVF
jgi:alkylation response protein AidB-like acyl-CoA dehydrogenase